MQLKSKLLVQAVVLISTFSYTFSYAQVVKEDFENLTSKTTVVNVKSAVEHPKESTSAIQSEQNTLTKTSIDSKESGQATPSVENDILTKKTEESKKVNSDSTDIDQVDPTPEPTTIKVISDFKHIPWQQKVTLGLNISPTSGLGFDASYRLTRKLSLKTAFYYNDIVKKNYTFSISSITSDAPNAQPQTFSFDVLYKFSSFNIGIDYAPFKRPWFRLLAGAAIYPSNNLTVKGELTSSIKFNDVELTPDDVGKGQFVVGFKSPINPYIGIGLGRLHPKKRMNVSFDMGAIYKTKYDFKIDVEEGGLIREDNENNAAVLSKNFNEKLFLRVLPNINIRVAYRL
jgi:hypothetical protein